MWALAQGRSSHSHVFRRPWGLLRRSQQPSLATERRLVIASFASLSLGRARLLDLLPAIAISHPALGCAVTDQVGPDDLSAVRHVLVGVALRDGVSDGARAERLVRTDQGLVDFVHPGAGRETAFAWSRFDFSNRIASETLNRPSLRTSPNACVQCVCIKPGTDMRCSRQRGHDGQHEILVRAPDTVDLLTCLGWWPADRDDGYYRTVCPYCGVTA